MSDNIDEIDPEDIAANPSTVLAGRTFHGITLEPFSFGRLSAAVRLGLLEDRQNAAIESEAMLVYLCTIPAERVREIRGEFAIKRFRADLEDFCDLHSVSLMSPARLEIQEIANQIWQEIADAQHQPAFEGKASGGKFPNDSRRP